MGKKLVDRDNLLEYLVEKQFNLVEKSVISALFNPNWKEEWTISKKQHEEWKKHCKFVMKKVLQFNNNKFLETFQWLEQHYGLKIK